MIRRVLSRKAVGNSGFLGLPPDLHVRSWEGVNLDGSSNFVSLTDLSGNGNDLTTTGASYVIPTIATSLNGLDALVFNGSSRIGCNVNFNASDTEYFMMCVFKITGANTGNPGHIVGIFNNDDTSYGNHFALTYQSGAFKTRISNVANTTTIFTHAESPVLSTSHYAYMNFTKNDPVDGDKCVAAFNGNAEDLVSSSVAASFNANFLSVGGWRNTRNAVMEFLELVVIKGKYSDIDATFLSDLDTYIANTYGI